MRMPLFTPSAARAFLTSSSRAFAIASSGRRDSGCATPNAGALAGYQGERAELYGSLKLAGLRDAPVHLAVCADPSSSTGHGLGRQTMPDTLTWSVVMAIHSLWLAARAAGLGMGWVSILDPAAAHESLGVPSEWTFLAYLCLGWPRETHTDPLLERANWEGRLPEEELVLRR